MLLWSPWIYPFIEQTGYKSRSIIILKAYEDLYDIQVEKHGVPEDMFTSGILEPKMTDDDIPKLISLINGRQRVWLVYSHNWYTDPKGLIPQTLASKMTLTRQRDFFGGQVQLYAAP